MFVFIDDTFLKWSTYIRYVHYTDAWSTDSTYYQITKIPGYALSLLKKAKKKEIYLYPNPCHSPLNIPHKGVDPIYSVEIYSQSGQLVKQFRDVQNVVDVESLPPAIYVVKLTDKKGEVFVHILQKE